MGKDRDAREMIYEMKDGTYKSVIIYGVFADGKVDATVNGVRKIYASEAAAIGGEYWGRRVPD